LWDRKSLIGDLYLLREFATVKRGPLLGAVLQALLNTPYMLRVEAQLLMMHGPFRATDALLALPQSASANFMMADLADVRSCPARYRTHIWILD